MKAVFYSDNEGNIAQAYNDECISRIKTCFDIGTVVINKKVIEKKPDIAADVEAIFTTWGMEHFSAHEIRKYFPRLRYIFYAAGSVQHFAKEFLECGVRIFSASNANAIPVAQYTLAQIILANKGMFTAMKYCVSDRDFARNHSSNNATNYNAKIGILGVGMIGKMVCKLLTQTIDCEIFYYDPFLPENEAKELGIKQATLDEIFSLCDCISNHLADKNELAGILNYSLFSKMKPYATFINTGRGRQVDESGLVKAMRECKTRAAVLDVTYPEPPSRLSRLTNTDNIFLTPHIAGSLGNEVFRMGDYMADEACRIANSQLPLFEVTTDMLKTMA